MRLLHIRVTHLPFIFKAASGRVNPGVNDFSELRRNHSATPQDSAIVQSFALFFESRHSSKTKNIFEPPCQTQQLPSLCLMILFKQAQQAVSFSKGRTQVLFSPYFVSMLCHENITYQNRGISQIYPGCKI